MAAARKPGCGSPRRRVTCWASPRPDPRRSGRASSRRGSISRKPSTPRSPTLESHRRRASNARWASGSPAPTCGGVATTSSRRAPPFAHIALDTDAYTTLLGAHEGRPGAIVTAGTGSVGEALHRDGMRVAAGGWGFPVGDEGSGAWLGLHAMRETHRAIDGRGPVGPLVGAVLAIAGTTREALLAWCDRPGQNAYAELAPLVFDAAATDPFAGASARSRRALARGNRGRARSARRVAAGDLRQHRTKAAASFRRHRSGRAASSRRAMRSTARFVSSARR